MPDSARSAIPLVHGLSALADDFDVLLCDVFGTIHDANGIFPAAIEALSCFSDAGGTVVLMSNAAAPSAELAKALVALGVPPACFDVVVTSAEIARTLLRRRAIRRVHHIGPAADRIALDGLDVRLSPIATADIILCTGYPVDDLDTETFADALARDLTLLCTNPDTQVTASGKVLRFAGLVANHYRDLGGRVIVTGKPDGAIYAEALDRAAELRPALDLGRVLAIGDSFALDVVGALDYRLNALWVSATMPGGLDPATAGRLRRSPTLTW